jgi:hypothetical protein
LSFVEILRAKEKSEALFMSLFFSTSAIHYAVDEHNNMSLHRASMGFSLSSA